MQEPAQKKTSSNVTFWLLAMVCMAVIIGSFAFGAAYTGIRTARQVAARASVGQIESVYLLAAAQAEQQGLQTGASGRQSLLKSYDVASATNEYDAFLLNAMLDTFGPARDFDFAVMQISDGTGVRTEIYYFPVKGQVDLGSDRYYLLTDGELTEKNL